MSRSCPAFEIHGPPSTPTFNKSPAKALSQHPVTAFHLRTRTGRRSRQAFRLHRLAATRRASIAVSSAGRSLRMSGRMNGSYRNPNHRPLLHQRDIFSGNLAGPIAMLGDVTGNDLAIEDDMRRVAARVPICKQRCLANNDVLQGTSAICADSRATHAA